jgi:hypothetical protein
MLQADAEVNLNQTNSQYGADNSKIRQGMTRTQRRFILA